MERRYFNYNQLGVFRYSMFGTTCAYFVGWKKWDNSLPRNIRAGLYFPTAEAAIKFRDDIENARKVHSYEIDQIA